MTVRRLTKTGKSLVAFGLSVLLVFSWLSPSLRELFRIETAHAVGGYSAYDLIGHVTTGETVSYTSGGFNNAPNPRTSEWPSGIVVDPVGHRLFVADNSASRVLVYDLNAGTNQLIDRIADAVLGQPDLYSGSTATTQSGLAYPAGLAIDQTNNRLFVADAGNNRVIVYDIATVTSGENAVYVLGQSSFTDGSVHAVSDSSFESVYGVAFDDAGDRLFVSDSNRRRILVFDLSGGISNNMSASKVLGQDDFSGSDFNKTGDTTPNQSGLFFNLGLDYEPSTHYLYVADPGNARVMVFNVGTTVGDITDGQNAVYVLGEPDFESTDGSGPGAPTDALLGYPTDVKLDTGSNLLFVTEQYNNRVSVFNVSTIGNGESSVYVLGQPNATTRPGGVTQSDTENPWSIGYDGSNDYLYVGDSANNRVLVFDISTIVTGEPAVDALGQLDADDNPQYTENLHADPQGYNGGSSAIALDAENHRLFVGDYGNSRVTVFNLDASNQLLDHTADAVLGQSDFYTTGCNATQWGMCHPAGLAYDPNHDRLFVGDVEYNRVTVFDVASITNGENAAFVIGQTNFTNVTEYFSTDPTRGFHTTSVYDVEYDAAHDRLFADDAGRVLVFDGNAIATGMQWDNYLPGAYGLAYDPDQNRLFGSDTNQVLVYDVSTIIDNESAVNTLGQISNDSGTSATELYGVFGLAYGANQLYVVDQYNNRIMQFDVESITDEEPAVDVYGQDDFVTGDNNGYSASSFGSGAMYGVEVDPSSDTLYADDAYRILFFGISGGATPPPGATAKDYSMGMSSSAPGAGNNLTLTFTTAQAVPAGLGKIIIDFPAEFTMNGVNYADMDLLVGGSDIALAAASSGATWGVNLNDHTITFSSDTGTISADTEVIIRIGTHASYGTTGDTQVTNPTSIGSYLIHFETFDDILDEGDVWVAIVDPVWLTADVDSYFEFAVDAATSGTSGDGISSDVSTSTSACDFGSLTANATKTCAQTLNARTNAASGFVVTVEQNHNMLASSGADIDAFANGSPSAGATWSAPTAVNGSEATYGHMGLLSTDNAAAGTSSASFFGLSGTSQKTVFSHPNPVSGGTYFSGPTDYDGANIATMLYRIEISALQEPGHYANRLMYIGTATF